MGSPTQTNGVFVVGKSRGNGALYAACGIGLHHLPTALFSPVGTIELAELDGLQQLGSSKYIRERLVGMRCGI